MKNKHFLPIFKKNGSRPQMSFFLKEVFLVTKINRHNGNENFFESFYFGVFSQLKITAILRVFMEFSLG